MYIYCCEYYCYNYYGYSECIKKEGDVMEIRKIIILMLSALLLSGCSLLESEVECNKKANTEYYNYNIDMRIIFDNKDNVKRVVSNIKYQLTDKGLENLDAMKNTLSEKKKTYDRGAYVKFTYEINNGIIDMTEDINVKNIKDITSYYDLSTSYIQDKTNKDDVKGILRKNNFTCD